MAILKMSPVSLTGVRPRIISYIESEKLYFSRQGVQQNLQVL